MIAQMRAFLRVFVDIGLVATFVIGGQWSLFAQPSNPPNSDREKPNVPAEDLEFFEQKIRPVLEKHCVECHSQGAVDAKKLKGGLRVDSRDGLLRGGDSGPAIVPNKPGDSLLLQALRYESTQMPPSGKLSERIIADFERWITKGAADPRTQVASPKAANGIDIDQGRRHWSYQPLRNPPIPDFASPLASSRSPVDQFVLAKLQNEKRQCTERADRGTLVRRVYFDLAGLPPSPDDIDAFVADESPDAFERVVDRLMASPHFGARWGRHWLSVARFAESVTLRGLIQPEAWRYRDYVIDSFNADLPFDRFVIEQLAGDLIPAESLTDRQRQLVATTYLTLGNHNLEEQDKQQLRMDVVDEQLDAIGKGFLAQTIGCARCHDHKFDPIPTKDYYAMAGILANVKTLEDANVSKWLELPLPLEPVHESELAQHESAVAAIQSKLDTVKKAQQKLQKAASRLVVVSKTLQGIIVDDRQAKVVGDWQQSQSIQPYIDEGYLHDRNSGKGDKTITLLPELPKAGRYEVRLAYTAGDNRCDAVPVTVMSADGEKTIFVNQKQQPPIDGLFVSLGQFRFELNGQGFVIVSTGGTTGHVIVDAAQFLPVESTAEAQAASQSDPKGLSKLEQEEMSRLNQEVQSLQQELKRLQSNSPHRPRFMSVQEQPKATDLRVHIRGTVHNLGDVVPRGFMQVATNGEPVPLPTTVSGRRELGEWIVSHDNPLTARVLANRVWLWMFGAGLVRSPDNFGTTGESPTHPELLDWLAVRLHQRHWSMKSLIREIVQTRTYMQSSESNVENMRWDPDNRWLSHQTRRRLDAECLLDAILTVSGQRDDEIGGNTIPAGKAEDYGYVHRSNRRAAYWPVFRNALPEIFEIFDFADPSLPSGSRSVSTVASQSLFFMNDDWVATQSKQSASRFLAEPHRDNAARVDWIFRSILGRRPTTDELGIALRAVSQPGSNDDSWASVIKALFASIDFRYVE